MALIWSRILVEVLLKKEQEKEKRGPKPYIEITWDVKKEIHLGAKRYFEKVGASADPYSA